MMRNVSATLEELLEQVEKASKDEAESVRIDDILVVILRRFQEIEQRCASFTDDIHKINCYIRGE